MFSWTKWKSVAPGIIKSCLRKRRGCVISWLFLYQIKFWLTSRTSIWGAEFGTVFLCVYKLPYQYKWFLDLLYLWYIYSHSHTPFLPHTSLTNVSYTSSLVFHLIGRSCIATDQSAPALPLVYLTLLFFPLPLQCHSHFFICLQLFPWEHHVFNKQSCSKWILSVQCHTEPLNINCGRTLYISHLHKCVPLASFVSTF